MYLICRLVMNISKQIYEMTGWIYFWITRQCAYPSSLVLDTQNILEKREGLFNSSFEVRLKFDLLWGGKFHLAFSLNLAWWVSRKNCRAKAGGCGHLDLSPLFIVLHGNGVWTLSLAVQFLAYYFENISSKPVIFHTAWGDSVLFYGPDLPKSFWSSRDNLEGCCPYLGFPDHWSLLLISSIQKWFPKEAFEWKQKQNRQVTARSEQEHVPSRFSPVPSVSLLEASPVKRLSTSTLLRVQPCGASDAHYVW